MRIGRKGKVPRAWASHHKFEVSHWRLGAAAAWEEGRNRAGEETWERRRIASGCGGLAVLATGDCGLWFLGGRSWWEGDWV